MTAPFDAHAEAYDAELAAGLALTGESKEYYARRRVQWVQRRLGDLRVEARHVVDFGCGDGVAAPLLRTILGASTVLGVDVSDGLLAIARARIQDPAIRFARPEDARPDGTADLAFTNGVFHHILPAERAAALADVRARLRPGGLFAFWENNPWNPGTRFIMRRVAFDDDAILISPPAARRLLGANGFDPLRIDSCFYFPRPLAWLRPLELPLARIPLGGQYLVLARRAS